MCTKPCLRCFHKKEFTTETEKLDFVVKNKLPLPRHELKQLKCRAKLEDPYTELGGE